MLCIALLFFADDACFACLVPALPLLLNCFGVINTDRADAIESESDPDFVTFASLTTDSDFDGFDVIGRADATASDPDFVASDAFALALTAVFDGIAVGSPVGSMVVVVVVVVAVGFSDGADVVEVVFDGTQSVGLPVATAFSVGFPLGLDVLARDVGVAVALLLLLLIGGANVSSAVCVSLELLRLLCRTSSPMCFAVIVRAVELVRLFLVRRG